MRSIRTSIGSLLIVLALLGAWNPARAELERAGLGPRVAGDGAALDLTDLVSTIAGYHQANDGAAAVAHFHGPVGAALSADGAFALVADTGDHTIRKIVFATGMVTTFAGNAGESGTADGIGTAARFYAPSDVTISPNGLFALVADTANNTIRKIDMTSGLVSTFAGDSAASGSADGIGTAALFFSPNSVSISADGEFALVADTDNDTIRKIDLLSAAVTTLAGTPGEAGDIDGSGNRALFNRPTGVDMGGGNDPFALVADQLNSTIRRIDMTTGVVTTLAGTTGDDGDTDGTTGDIRFNMPTSVAVSADGARALVADTGNSSIREIRLDSDQIQVRTLALTASSIEAAPATAGPAITFIQPVGVALSADGTRGIAVDMASSIITRIDVEGQYGQQIGVTDQIYAPTDNHLNGPESVAMSDNGHVVLVANTVNQTIERLTLAVGATEIIAGSPGVVGSADGVGREASFAYPVGIALSADGTVAVVADRDNHTIREIDMATRQVTTLAGMAGVAGAEDGVGAEAMFTMPQAVAISGDKTYVLVADSYNHAIRRIDMATHQVTTLAGSLGVSGSSNGVGGAALFSLPSGVAICDAGA
ncbi:MAG: NHL repeat-containing protein, partial [Chloroflexales bacterium]